MVMAPTIFHVSVPIKRKRNTKQTIIIMSLEDSFMRAGGPVLMVVGILGIISTAYAIQAYNASAEQDKNKPVVHEAWSVNVTMITIYVIATLLSIFLTWTAYSTQGQKLTRSLMKRGVPKAR